MALTKQDFIRLEKKFSIKEELQKLSVETKIEFKKALDDRTRMQQKLDWIIKALDKMFGEIRTVKDELLILNDHYRQYGERIEKLEGIHPKGRHIPNFI